MSKSNRGKNSIASQISRIKAGKAAAVAKKGYGKDKNTRYLTKSKFKGQRVYIYVLKGR